jgi:hypothetical protein
VTITADKIEEMNLFYPDSIGKSKKICPRGHTDNLIPIVYGLPGKKLMTKSQKGKVRLGVALSPASTQPGIVKNMK